jgi:transposase-like protein
MSQKNVSMDKVLQITRLFKEGVTIKEIVRRLSISCNSIKKYVKRLYDNPDAKDVVLSPEIAYGSPQAEDTRRRYQGLLQYFSKASCDLGRTGVTQEVLWGEYMLLHANG